MDRDSILRNAVLRRQMFANGGRVNARIKKLLEEIRNKNRFKENPKAYTWINPERERLVQEGKQREKQRAIQSKFDKAQAALEFKDARDRQVWGEPYEDLTAQVIMPSPKEKERKLFGEAVHAGMPTPEDAPYGYKHPLDPDLHKADQTPPAAKARAKELEALKSKDVKNDSEYGPSQYEEPAGGAYTWFNPEYKRLMEQEEKQRAIAAAEAAGGPADAGGPEYGPSQYEEPAGGPADGPEAADAAVAKAVAKEKTTEYLPVPSVSNKPPKQKTFEEIKKLFGDQEASGKVLEPEKEGPDEPEDEQSFFDILSDKVDLFSAGLDIARRGAIGQYQSRSGVSGFISDVTAGLQVGRKERLRQEKDLREWEEKRKSREQKLEVAAIKEKGENKRARFRNFKDIITNRELRATEVWKQRHSDKTRIEIYNAQARAQADERVRQAIIRERLEAATLKHRGNVLEVKKEMMKLKREDIERETRRRLIKSYEIKKISQLNVPNWGAREMLLFQDSALFGGKNLDKFIHPGKGVLPKKEMKTVMASIARGLVARIDPKGDARKKQLIKIVKSWITANKSEYVPSELMRRFAVRKAVNKTFGNPLDYRNRPNYENTLTELLEKFEGVGEGATPKAKKLVKSGAKQKVSKREWDAKTAFEKALGPWLNPYKP
jgi:hypothetical protein